MPKFHTSNAEHFRILGDPSQNVASEFLSRNTIENRYES